MTDYDRYKLEQLLLHRNTPSHKIPEEPIEMEKIWPQHCIYHNANYVLTIKDRKPVDFDTCQSLDSTLQKYHTIQKLSDKNEKATIPTSKSLTEFKEKYLE